MGISIFRNKVILCKILNRMKTHNNVPLEIFSFDFKTDIYSLKTALKSVIIICVFENNK